MSLENEPGFGTIMCELGTWIKKKFILLLWGTEGLSEWMQKNQHGDELQDVKFEYTTPIEPQEPLDNSKELVSRIKAFASCPLLSKAQASIIVDYKNEIIEPSIYRQTWFKDYTNHRDCDVDSNEKVSWNIAVLYMIGEMEKNNKGKSYTIEEVEEALVKPYFSQNKITVAKPEFDAIVSEFENDALNLTTISYCVWCEVRKSFETI